VFGKVERRCEELDIGVGVEGFLTGKEIGDDDHSNAEELGDDGIKG
jgi:hypothetical protein